MAQQTESDQQIAELQPQPNAAAPTKNGAPTANPASKSSHTPEWAAGIVQKRYRSYIGVRESAGLNLSKPQRSNPQVQPPAASPSASGTPSPGAEGSPLTHKGSSLSSQHRWKEGLDQRKFTEQRQSANEGKNDVHSRWQRTGFYAGRLVQGSSRQDKEGDEGENKEEAEEGTDVNKLMEPAYWLEMVDSKHRYSSNLKHYHAYWNNEANTNDSFFHWLDEGEGKDLDLEIKPRAQLEAERITYLSAEQRRNYLIRIDDKGKLRWVNNDRLVDTQKGKHKDAGPNKGIVDVEEGHGKEEEQAGDSSDEDESGSEKEPEYKRTDNDSYPGRKKKNIWIYVCDLQYNLYIGLKQTGKFQHSSFLYGSRVRSAGSIKVKNGQLTSLTPMSGHYKAGSVHFKAFAAWLDQNSVDLSKVSITKSLATIGAIERYGALTKHKKSFTTKIKQKLGLLSEKDKAKLESKDEDKQRIAQMERDPEEEGKKTTQGTFKVAKAPQEIELPFEGKDMKDMSEKERMERGIALVQRAVARGLKPSEEASKSKDDSAAKASKVMGNEPEAAAAAESSESHAPGH